MKETVGGGLARNVSSKEFVVIGWKKRGVRMRTAPDICEAAVLAKRIAGMKEDDNFLPARVDTRAASRTAEAW